MANTSTRGILLTMLSAVTFGFAFTLGPMTYGEAGSNPVTLTFLRNFLSLPVLLAILWYQGISLQVSVKELWSLTILGGIGNAVTTLMLFIAFSLIDVGVATTIHFIYPVFVTIGCVLFYKERLGLQKFIALLIAAADRHQACRCFYCRYFDYLRAYYQHYLRRTAFGRNSDYDQDRCLCPDYDGRSYTVTGKTKKASGRGSYRSGRLINLSKPTNPPVNKTTVKDRTAA